MTFPFPITLSSPAGEIFLLPLKKESDIVSVSKSSVRNTKIGAFYNYAAKFPIKVQFEINTYTAV